MPVVNNIGMVNQATIPTGWFELPRQPSPFEESWTRSFTLNSNPQVELTFRFRGNEIDKTSATTFKELLQARFDSNDQTPLTPTEIRELQVVMGYETAGDNQYTFLASPLSSRSSAHLASVRQPVFDLTCAFIRQVNHRAVLFVDGKFKSGNLYCGAFYVSSHNDRIVEEFMLHAPSQQLFKLALKHFDSVLNSFVWNDTANSGT